MNGNDNRTMNTSNSGRTNRNIDGGNYNGNFIYSLKQEIRETEMKLDRLHEMLDMYGGGTIGNRDFSMSGRSNRGYGDRNFNNDGGRNRGNSQPIRSSQRDHGLRNEDGSVDERQFNPGRRNFSGGSNDINDDRTEAGRVAHDAEDFSQDELYDFLNNPDQNDLNEDGSFDRRTKVGRALYAAGLIDDNGNPNEEAVGNIGRNRNRNRSNSGRGD